MAYKAFFDHKRRFGIEAEVFGISKYELQFQLRQNGIPSEIELYEDPDVPHWTVTFDGSIKGEDPIELISPILKGFSGLETVSKVLTILGEMGAKTNDSCGFHAHWDIKDYTGKNILSLLRLYTKFEPVMDGLVAPSRRGDKNKHCRSLIKDENLAWISELDKTEKARALEVALKFDQIHKKKNFGTVDYFGSRLHKVNIASYFKYATVEFRHCEGTTDPEKAINWIVLTQEFVNKAKQSSVSREISSKPSLAEMIRVLGMSEAKYSGDMLVDQSREWLKKTKKGDMWQSH